MYRVLSKTELARTRWLRLIQVAFSRDDQTHYWDAVERVHNNGHAENSQEVVVVSGIMKSKLNSTVETLLVKQWRPPVGNYTIEFPAGLIDDGEDVETAATRELKEETGFIPCKTLHVSPPLPLSPGLSDERARLVTFEIDLDDPRNQRPVQDLEETEDIEVIRVPISDLYSTLNTFASDHGYLVFSGVYAVAHGILLAQRLGL